MSDHMTTALADTIIAKAKELGADLAGIASVKELQQSPSHLISDKMPDFDNVAAKHVEGREKGQVDWPEGGRSVILVCLSHPEDKPELDWWILGGKSKAGNTPGNRKLMSITKELRVWLESQGVNCFPVPYHIELGGIYMKDAAVLSGLGCIGKNNLLVTPEFGPRQRLRALIIDRELSSTGPVEFDPCSGCDAPCRTACPVGAFDRQLYHPEEYGFSELPGRTGVYSRPVCSAVMDEASENYEPIEIEGQEEPGKMARFCRKCEFSCPVGQPKQP